MMGILDFLFGRRPESASVAKERLQIIVSQERAGRNAPDFLPLLQQEVLSVVAKYLDVDDDAIRIVHSQKAGGAAVLDINIELDKALIRPMPRAAARNGEQRSSRLAAKTRAAKAAPLPRGA